MKPSQNMFGCLLLALALGGSFVHAAEKGSGRGAAQDLITPIKALEPKTHMQQPILIGCPICKADWLGRAGRSPKSVDGPATRSFDRNRCAVCGMELDLMPSGKPANTTPAQNCATSPAKK